MQKPNEAKTFARILFFRFKRIRAEVALGKFVGFLLRNPLGQARNCEIRLGVY